MTSAEVIPISALKRTASTMLLEMVIAALPAGPAYFPEDQITDQPARFMAAEIIREQVLLNTSEEIPYATTVIVDNFEEGARLTRIAATIYCEREGQKGILVGKGGADAEEDRHVGPPADRAHAGDESLSRTLRESRARMARLARALSKNSTGAGNWNTECSSRRTQGRTDNAVKCGSAGRNDTED